MRGLTEQHQLTWMGTTLAVRDCDYIAIIQDVVKPGLLALKLPCRYSH